MNKIQHRFLRAFLVAAVACAALSLSGCKLDDSAVAGFLYEEVGGQYVVTDQFYNSITFSSEQARQIAGLGEEAAAAFLTARFRNTFPEAYQDPAAQVRVAAEVAIPGEVQVSQQAQAMADGLTFLPGVGQLASLLANGALGIGALWLRNRRSRAEKVSASLVQGIDVFRDILEQTPQGERIDARLTDVLKKRQGELGVAREVGRLLERYATPTKRPIELQQ